LSRAVSLAFGVPPNAFVSDDPPGTNPTRYDESQNRKEWDTLTEEFKCLAREIIGRIASVLVVAAVVFAFTFWLSHWRR
jgi:hypothetical protein